MRDLRDDGRCAGAGAAAHAGGDEDHIGALEHLGDESLGFLSGFLADVGLGACAHAAGQLFADLDLVLALGLFKVLLIRIDCNKFNALDIGRDHAVDNIVAGAADTNDFDPVSYTHLQSEIISKIPSDFLLEIRRDLSVCTPDTVS